MDDVGHTPVYTSQYGACHFHNSMTVLTYVWLVLHCVFQILSTSELPLKALFPVLYILCSGCMSLSITPLDFLIKLFHFFQMINLFWWRLFFYSNPVPHHISVFLSTMSSGDLRSKLSISSPKSQPKYRIVLNWGLTPAEHLQFILSFWQQTLITLHIQFSNWFCAHSIVISPILCFPGLLIKMSQETVTKA